MRTIKSWLIKKLAKWAKPEDKASEVVPAPPKKPKYNALFYENPYSLIASGARLKLVEAMFNLNIFALFENKPYVLESEIISALELHPTRAKKWLHLLSTEHFLIKIKSNDYQTAYRLPKELIQLIKGPRWWAIQFFFNSWNYAANEDLTDVLRSGQVKLSVSWPPKTDAEVEWLEDWMRNTAHQPVHCLLQHIDFKKINYVLDVGGGDGTMACKLVKAHPHLKVAVYNLPKSAELARKNIAAQGLSQQVTVIEGDFIADDAFPVGFDLILFIRVLFDWDEQVDRKLLRMAYQALDKKKQVAICEFFKERNYDQCLASEYRYIFHDDFAPNVMKTATTYQTLLRDIGFSRVSDILPEYEEKTASIYCSLLLAEK